VPLLATFIQQSLQAVGIKVEIVNLDTAGALSTVEKRVPPAPRLKPASSRSAADFLGSNG
jgi:ABC-type transport system substrate-binding protein